MSAAIQLSIAVASSVLFACMTAAADTYKAPRTSDGQPDLQGFWTNATLTPVERPASLGNKLVLSEAEAKAMENQMARRMQEASAPSDPNEVQRAGQAVGGYNMFWADFGTQVAIVNGEHRSSLIVDPPQGRVPELRPDAQKLVSAAERRGYDGPEQRPLGERCLLAFGNASGPPMLPVMYNSNYQIVQTGDTVMILVEMPHDVRLIHLDNKPLPAGLRPWMGHSLGRWEGETLVVETSRLRKEQYISIGGGGTYRYVPSSENLKVIERFTRTGPRTILYEFKVEDPEIFTQSWGGQVPLNAIDTPLYEYACHEGNYALPGILAGARETEKNK
ncbi:MAG TPA: hypothetical protein VJT80_17905 [Steroidobacteraceae bacterium]|nr:hypothetical protein [Steroidobacteraceae bacterium]